MPIDPRDEWKNWNPSTQEKALAALNAADPTKWTPFYCPRPDCDGNHHIETQNPVCIDGFQHRWEKTRSGWRCATSDGSKRCPAKGTPQDSWLFRHARAHQKPPTDPDWLAWLQLAGRGSGKTRSGSEWTHRIAERLPDGRFALIAPTRADIRDTIVEGESGLLATARPGQLPEWEPSKLRLTWPNGFTAFGYSGEEPDRLRGRQHHYGWLDEPAHMPLIDEVWYNFLLGLRLGPDPKVTLTTSPLPTKWLKDLMAEPRTRISRASTYDNIRNLPLHYQQTILGRFEGTHLGAQEIHGEVVEDAEGALWNGEMIEHADRSGELTRVVVGIDPAGTANRSSDETGIVVVALREDLRYHVLADYSGRYSPNGWAEKALWAYDQHKADALVPEVTYGRDMVISTITSTCEKKKRETPHIIPVDSRRGKVIRAEPVVAMYERGEVVHSPGMYDLETQMRTWLPTDRSPDRIDALVHGLTELARRVAPASIASPYKLARNAAKEVQDLYRILAERRYAS